MTQSVRTIAGWVSLAIFLGSCALPLLTAHDLDLDCGASTQASVADSGGATVRAVQSQAIDTHCTLCHWLRAVRGSQTGSAVTAEATPVLSAAVDRYAESSLGLLSRCDGPLRAPPVATS